MNENPWPTQKNEAKNPSMIAAKARNLRERRKKEETM
jgi:hypothetical protein